MKTPVIPYLLALGTGLAACFALQTVLLHRAGGKSVKSESNFFSSIARLQNGSRDQPQVLLLGSSMTGRLPDRSRGFPGVANMGCDGGSAVEILHAIDRGDLPPAALIIVESNTLRHGFELEKAGSHGGSEVAAEIGTWHFRAGRKAPNFGAAARPSALIYSTLMERKLGGGTAGAEGLHPTTVPQISLPPSLAGVESPPPLAGDLEKPSQSLVQAIARITSKGARIVIVMLPGAGGPEDRDAGQVIAASAGISFWDLAGAIDKNAVELTDGTHMAPASAAATMTTLMQELHP